MERQMDLTKVKIAIIGLGYVGLPLAVEFSKFFKTIGFDIDKTRIEELRNLFDRTNEITKEELIERNELRFSHYSHEILDCNVYIITVPTPVDVDRRPDLSPLVNASRFIGKILKKGDLVIYESTVYPGVTEDKCIPELEQKSKLRLNLDFMVGYSPERINPGDKIRRLKNICKVTSGSNDEAAVYVDELYKRIIIAGTHKASSIKVAEASKIIENTQRDANIAVMNEFSMIFERLGIDTIEVLEASETKWNFLPFRPGLVGGHCIGVDPYYLIQKAQSVGYYPNILLYCRRVNEAMGEYIASEVIKLLIKKDCLIKKSKILILGFSFKENCPDLRNTKVIDLVNELIKYGVKVDIHDPYVDPQECKKEYGVDMMKEIPKNSEYDAIVIAVAHREFYKMGIDNIKKYGSNKVVIYDIKGIYPKSDIDKRL